ncbi:hypothetical protein B0H11DRAFT_2210274 [Mycena galericulata]|nr:hypothetical protein B0H11DRAFT_2210274 [Mycena galericulata]
MPPTRGWQICDWFFPLFAPLRQSLSAIQAAGDGRGLKSLHEMRQSKWCTWSSLSEGSIVRRELYGSMESSEAKDKGEQDDIQTERKLAIGIRRRSNSSKLNKHPHGVDENREQISPHSRAIRLLYKGVHAHPSASLLLASQGNFTKPAFPLSVLRFEGYDVDEETHQITDTGALGSRRLPNTKPDADREMDGGGRLQRRAPQAVKRSETSKS